MAAAKPVKTETVVRTYDDQDNVLTETTTVVTQTQQDGPEEPSTGMYL